MSRPKTVRSKARSKTPPSETKQLVKATTTAAKDVTPDSTPDQKAQSEHQAKPQHEAPPEPHPWSEWLWSEESQMCYRGRKDLKGEWEYELAPLPPLPAERPYTPPMEEPITYLVEELKTIWVPQSLGEVTVYKMAAGSASGDEVPKAASASEDSVPKAKVPDEEEKPTESKEDKTTKGDETESKDSIAKKPEKSEKFKKERHLERRGRQLERKHFSYKDKKDMVEVWRSKLE